MPPTEAPAMAPVVSKFLECSAVEEEENMEVVIEGAVDVLSIMISRSGRLKKLKEYNFTLWHNF